MFKVDCFIRKNTSELRKKLEELGHTICKCCDFEGADWLDIITHKDASYTVHGIGYDGEFDDIYGTLTQQERFSEFLKTTNSIDCGTNEELFLALAALRDEIDRNQWFVNTKNDWYLCKDNKFREEIADWLLSTSADNWHKATVEEIIEHFKK